MYRGHIIGGVIRTLREMRTTGAKIPELMQFMAGVMPDNRGGAVRYLNKAFCQGLRLSMAFPPFTTPDPEMVEHAELWIDEKRAIWESHQFPILNRTRDYFSFLEFARDEGLYVFVCGATPDEKGYRLHGVYDSSSGESAWSGSRGEKLRGAINRRLGGELIRSGPHDDWQQRNEVVAAQLRGPQVPVIEFNTELYISNYETIQGLATTWPYNRHWARLYPDHLVTP